MRHLQRTQSNMSGGDAARLMERKPLFMSETAYKAMSYAIAVNEANAKMFRIVAAQRRGLVALCLAPFRPWLSNTN